MEQRETSLRWRSELRPRCSRQRGFFLETYHQAKLAEIGIVDCFVQDNHSCSSREHCADSITSCDIHRRSCAGSWKGEALDVAVDIRVGSPQFGKWTSVRLSAKEQNQIYIPAGFAWIPGSDRYRPVSLQM
jgi:dTDP-4-dehydrorhamnose 3,5-epimerase and related enzymes